MKLRRENYIMLWNALSDFSLCGELRDEVVPLGFPIKVSNRDILQSLFFQANIFPPVHWNISEIIPRDFKESHRLSREELTLPCDQRYGKEEMSKIIDVIWKNEKAENV
jgi:hypothetical protein